MVRSASTTEFCPLGENTEIEYFFASDASAIIEHTNRVIFLEDDDVAAVSEGKLTIHRLKRDANAKTSSPGSIMNGTNGNGQTSSLTREIMTLKLQLQEIMKGTGTKSALIVS